MNQHTLPKKKPLFALALLAVPFVFVVIALGAFTRLSNAGLGCPDWPTCYGHVLWPDSAHEIYDANQTYNETPVETDKTWPEQVHRIFASSLGIISLTVFFLSLRLSKDKTLNRQLVSIIVVLVTALAAKIAIKVNMKITAAAMHDSYDIIIGLIVLGCVLFLGLLGWRKGTAEQPVKLPAFIVAFVILQGLFGMWTVTLKVWPQVVTLHLLGGFTMAALFWLLALRLGNAHWQLPKYSYEKVNRLKPLVLGAFLVVILQITLGGWTTTNYAAVACPDLPRCQNQWWPDMDFVDGFNLTQAVGPNYLGGKLDNEARIAIHMAHRMGAIVTTFTLLVLIILLGRIHNPATHRMAKWISGALLVQVSLGLSNILFHFPLPVAVAHNAGGAFLLLTMVTLMHRTFTVKKAG
jgi:cytochrome c oxidase assembly protein subunit 15